MKYKIITHNPCKVIGKEERFNLADARASQKIGQLWQAVYKQRLFDAIPSLNRPIDIVGLYTNYDDAGNYSLVVGCIVQSLDIIPQGLVGYDIPEARYAVFSLPDAKPETVADFWAELWREKESLDFTRAFAFDFELYNQLTQPSNQGMSVYISIL